MPPTAQAPTSSQMSPQQQNAAARQIIQSRAVEMTQPIFNWTGVPANFPVLNINPRSVGLIKGFFVNVTATIANASGATVTPTDYNAANIFSNITFTDLQNNVRINTTGWHLAMLNSIKAKRPFFNAMLKTALDSPLAIGNNFGTGTGLWSATASIATASNGTVSAWFWVPLAYSDVDYRGAIYANVLNATMNLQLTFNAQPGTAGTVNTNAIYKGGVVSISSATVNVYQVYMDQIPRGQNGLPVLPQLDLSTVYEMKNTIFPNIVQNQDFPMQYANFRDFLSTYVIFDDGSTTGSGGRQSGPDVAYWALQSANYTNLFKRDPYLQAGITRNILGTDVPPGSYYFSHRNKPIATTQYGNMQLILNASSIGADHTALCSVGYEDFALITTISQAGSLAY